jgi:hypothetical protein
MTFNSLEEFQQLDPYLGGGNEVLVCCEGVHGPLLEYLKHRGKRLYPVYSQAALVYSFTTWADPEFVLPGYRSPAFRCSPRLRSY